MQNYLNKIGLLKYNNSTFKPIDQPQYYKVRNPQLVSSNPDIDYFNFLFKFNEGWKYINYGSGWTYDGKNEIAYQLEIPVNDIKSRTPLTQDVQNDAFVYNEIHIHPYILSSVSANIINSNSFEYPSSLHIFQRYTEESLEHAAEYSYAIYNSDYTAPSTFILTGDINGALDYQSDPSSDPHGYIVQSTDISGVLCGAPFIKEGTVNDLFSNVLFFDVKSPNVQKIDDIELTENEVQGIFHNIGGTNYVSGICTTNMYFSEGNYVNMRGLFYGVLDLQNGVINEIAGPSTVVRKIRIKSLKGTLKNSSTLPQDLKFNIDSYYAWGWLYGVDNIIYEHTWYKNEISGLLQAEDKSLYNSVNTLKTAYRGILSTTIITNDGTQDIKNVLTGIFTRDKDQTIITGYLNGVIKPFDIQMKGYLTGYYNQAGFKYLKPIQLEGILYNKSTIDNNLRTILDIKYANTLGRKGLAYPYSLYGQNLNWTSKNFDYQNKPYMLQSWKIIEYKTSKEEIDYVNAIPAAQSLDLNTYIVDRNYLQQYRRSKVRMTDEELDLINLDQTQIPVCYVYWEKIDDQNYSQYKGNFAIVYEKNNSDQISTDTHKMSFNSEAEAEKYIKHLCSINNLKIKDCLNYSDQNIIKFVLDSSDVELT